jgi:hypothetical protein
MRRARSILGTIVVGLALVLPAAAQATVAGAGYTSVDVAYDGSGTCLAGNPAVNCNVYDAKNHVWLNGGPTSGQIAAGDYFFAVLQPSGQNDPNDGSADLLSSDAYGNRTFTKNGDGSVSYGGSHIFDSANGKIRLVPYADTANPGGVYIMAICSYDPATYDPVTNPVTASACKFDAFKVRAGDGTFTPFGVVSGMKYYDVNHNGQWDGGEVGIPNWPINFTDGVSGTLFTDGAGAFSDSFVADTYTFSEQLAGSPWAQTGNTVDQSSVTGGASVTLNGDKTYTVTVVDGSTASGLNFGNVCTITNTGGYTLGYWSNKNGQAVLKVNDTAWRTLLTGLNLVKANGTAYDISTVVSFATAYGGFRTWLLNATATNMSYMLSAQMATTRLNIAYMGFDGSATVFDPVSGTWKTINQLIVDANAFLGSNSNTTASGAARTTAEQYKNVFDALNNNLATITPSDWHNCPAPTFP